MTSINFIRRISPAIFLLFVVSCKPYKIGWCDKQKTAKYFVYKNPTKAWPVVKSGWDASIENSINLLNKIDTSKNVNITSNLNIKKNVVELRQKLGQLNIF